jgi:hypothetical protein
MDKPIEASHPIVGAWRLISFTVTNLETGTVRHPFGRGAKAFVIYTRNGYAATIFTAEGRRPPAAPQAERVRALSFSAHSHWRRFAAAARRVVEHAARDATVSSHGSAPFRRYPKLAVRGIRGDVRFS